MLKLAERCGYVASLSGDQWFACSLPGSPWCWPVCPAQHLRRHRQLHRGSSLRSAVRAPALACSGRALAVCFSSSPYFTSVLAIRFAQVCTSFEGSTSTLSFLLGPENVLYLLQWRQQSIWRRTGTLGGSEVKETRGNEASLRVEERRHRVVQEVKPSAAMFVEGKSTFRVFFYFRWKFFILRQLLFVYLLVCY